MKLSSKTRERLTAELEELQTNGLAETRAAIELARTQGDISQNPDFFSAAEDESRVLNRIAAIEAALAAHDEAADITWEQDVVHPGTLVTLDFGGDVEQYLVGSIEEARDGLEVLTAGSPVGQAVIGARVGTTVTLASGLGVTVVAVELR